MNEKKKLDFASLKIMNLKNISTFVIIVTFHTRFVYTDFFLVLE